MITLTKPQRALFYRIPKDGELIQNSKARSMVEALEKAGLINVDVRPRQHAYPIYALTLKRCAHGKIKNIGNIPSCDECYDALPRCTTCGRLT